VRAGLASSPGGHGTFFEDAEKAMILNHIPKPAPETLRSAIGRALRSMLDLGIVATIDAWIDDESRKAYLGLESEVQVTLGHWITSENWRSANFEDVDVKFFVDGVLGSATACVSEGYLDGVASGKPVWQADELTAALRKFDELGCRLHLHAIGDGAVDIALDHLAPLSRQKTSVLVHAELLRDDQIERLSELNIWVCSQPLWARVDSLSVGALKRLTDSQQNQLYRNRDLINAGALLAFGSDWPVSDVDPLIGIYTAVHRRVAGVEATVLNGSQAISLEEAIHAYTAAPAQMLGLDRSGDLKIGSRADFVVLSKNAFENNGIELPQTVVRAVYLAGTRVSPN
jgi:predicted amidohydrolase YtcJ